MTAALRLRLFPETRVDGEGPASTGLSSDVPDLVSDASDTYHRSNQWGR